MVISYNNFCDCDFQSQSLYRTSHNIVGSLQKAITLQIKVKQNNVQIYNSNQWHNQRYDFSSNNFPKILPFLK